MEVGPKRWSRASVSLNEGVVEMMLLAQQFENNFLALRTPSVGHHKTCPLSIAKQLRNTTPEREIHGVQLFRLARGDGQELKTVLTAMDKEDYDCNFWYTN